MVNTKHIKVDFGQIVHSQDKKESGYNTRGIKQGRIEVIKMIRKGDDDSIFSGYRKVNYVDQRAKETYRNINKVLGGN